MSMIAVHGPQTFGSRAIKETEELIGVVDPTNGLRWDFKLDSTTTRSAQDFAWTFPPDGTPTPQNVIDPSVVTYGAAGSKTATLTVTNTVRATINNRRLTNNVAILDFSAPHGFAVGQRVTISGAVGAPFTGTFTLTAAAGTSISYALVNADVTTGATTGTATSAADQYPAAGAHTIVVTAVVGAGPQTGLMSAPQEGGEDEESMPEEFDPGEHTVDEVKEYVAENPEFASEVYEAEVIGKSRLTLITWLEDFLPFDPSEHTIDEVKGYVEANPEEAGNVLESEQAGKNRVTLVSWLAEFQS